MACQTLIYRLAGYTITSIYPVKGYGSTGVKALVEPGYGVPARLIFLSYLVQLRKPEIASSFLAGQLLFHFKTSIYSLISCAGEFQMPSAPYCRTPSPGTVLIILLHGRWEINGARHHFR